MNSTYRKSQTEPVIYRSNPQLIIFLIDQSASMMEYKESVEEKINEILNKMIHSSRAGPQKIHNYYYVSVLGYCETLREGVVVEDLFNYTVDNRQVTNAIVKPLVDVMKCVNPKNKIRLDPRGLTPNGVFGTVKNIVKMWDNIDSWKNIEGWCEVENLVSSRNPTMLENISEDRCPPIIINITDGRFDCSIDGEISSVEEMSAIVCSEYRSFPTPILCNIFLKSGKNEIIDFPNVEPRNPSLREIYRYSSPLTESMYQYIHKMDEFTCVSETARACVIADINSPAVSALLSAATWGRKYMQDVRSEVPRKPSFDVRISN